MLTILLCTAAVLITTEGDQQPPGPNAQVLGRVVDADSKAPIAGARVMLFRVLQAPPVEPMMPPSTVTDENGRFAFGGLEPGRFSVNVQKQGYVIDPLSAPRLDLQAGQAASLEIALARGGVLAGRILDQHGEPLSDMRVSALRANSERDGRLMPAGQPLAPTNDLGEFRISGLAPGEYILVASALPMGPSGSALATTPTTAWAPTYYPGTSNQSEAQPVVLQQGDTVTGLEFRMLSAPAYRVSGIVVDETGKPVADAMINLRALRDGQQIAFGPGSLGRSNADGTFAIGGVISGRYAITATRMVSYSSGSSAASSTVTSVMTLALGPNRGEQEILVDGADLAGVRVIAPPPPRQ